MKSSCLSENIGSFELKGRALLYTTIHADSGKAKESIETQNSEYIIRTSMCITRSGVCCIVFLHLIYVFLKFC